MPRNWQGVVNGMTPVQKLVHLAMRQTPDDVERIRGELLRGRRRAYDSELSVQAAKVGCPGQRGSLQNGAILSDLADASQEDAASIVSTYNYDLAGAILAIAAETPSANRNTYVKRLRAWEGKRGAWKKQQITQFTENSARARAQQDFYQYNDVVGVATLQPTDAECPVCKGWIQRGEVPLRVAENNPPPYHPSCPHVWSTSPGKVAKEECRLLWMGR